MSRNSILKRPLRLQVLRVAPPVDRRAVHPAVVVVAGVVDVVETEQCTIVSALAGGLS